MENREGQFVALDGAQFRVDLRGEGRDADPIVFLHAGVADRRMWHPQLDALSASHPVLAYDRRGFGETQSADVPFSHVDDLCGLLDHFGFDRVCLAGCSQGGRISIDFTLRYPNRVSQLVLIAPAVSGDEGDGFAHPPEVVALFDALDAADDADDLERINAIEAHMWLDGPLSEEGRVAGPVRDLVLDMNRIALLAPELSGEREPPSALERLAELALPSLLIWGELDFPHVVDRCQRLALAIPDVKLMVVPEVAHLPVLEQPERLNRALDLFFEAR